MKEFREDNICMEFLGSGKRFQQSVTFHKWFWYLVIEYDGDRVKKKNRFLYNQTLTIV